ncbi:hypothetical protein ACX93W_22915 [Paenibacillus sp. CAU 1782]
MRRLYLTIILFALLTACSNQAEVQTIIFEAEGERWGAEIENKIIQHNGKSFFPIRYQYKGDAEDLGEVERITFALGTALGTQVVNVYDPSYREKLINDGAYQEEDEEQFGIIIEDIQNNKNTMFEINYNLITVEEDYTTIDAVQKEGVYILINWETENGKFEDQIK